MSKDKLTAKQELFIQYYLEDLNATQAAIRAGYSKPSACSIAEENLRKPEISERIKQELDRLKKKSQVTKEAMIEELRRIAFGNMGNLAKWNESGVRYKSSDELTPEAMSTVLSVEEETNQHGGKLKIKQHDKMRAMELLAKLHGYTLDKSEIELKVERPAKGVDETTLDDALVEDE